MDTKAKIEQQFENLAHVLYRNPLKTLFLIFVLIGALASQIPKITVDTSSEGMLHQDDPGLLEYNAYRDQFGGSTIILIGIKSPKIFTPEFFEYLENFHEDLENEVPFLNKVTSLVNIRNTRGEGDTLYADGLIQDWKNKSINIDKLKELALNNTLYQNSMISEDGNLVAILIETDASVTDDMDDQEDILSGFAEDGTSNEAPESKKRYFSEKDNEAVISAIDRVIARYQNKQAAVALTGRPVAMNTFNICLKKDMRLQLLVAIFLVAIFLKLLFNRLSGLILPFVPVFSALLSTLGMMALFDKPITLFSAILPSFLMAVGVAASIHILAIFYRHFHQDGSKDASIVYAFGHSGLALVLTSLTTAAGLLSFSFSELSALGAMGIYSAAGVMFALFYTFTMLPAIIALVPLKRIKTVRMNKRVVLMDNVLLFFADFSTSHPRKILMVSALIFIVSAAGVYMMKFSHNMLKYFPDSMSIKQDTEMIDKELKGTLVLRVVADTKKENGLYEPEVLNNIEKFIHNIEKIKDRELFVGKVISINNILKETNKALHGNDPAYYSIPQDRKMIAQEFLLFENTGSDDLEEIVDTQFSKTNITVKIPFIDYAIISDFLSRLTDEFNRVFQGSADITITGIPALMGRTIPLAQKSMAVSYAIALVVISFMMIFLLGSLRFGLLSMIPNLFPIMVIMGFMGYAGVPIDLSALMIGSIAIGLVVDDTMHFMYNFQKYYALSGNVKHAVRETMLGTGRAMLITSLVLSSFFFSVMLGSLKNSSIFGFYTGQVILIALLADFILLPALLTAALGSKKESRKTPVPCKL